MESHERDLYDLGLAADLAMLRRTPLGRRRVLRMGLAGIGLLLVGGVRLLQRKLKLSEQSFI